MVHRRGQGRNRLLAYRLVLTLAALFAAGPKAAHADDVFTVMAVPVDVTADTAAAAREQALLEGQHKGADILLRRLALREDYSKIPALTEAQLFEAVQGIEVEREKISTVRYLGDLTVRFKPDPIRNILRTAAIRYAETVSKPLVVVPVYHAGDQMMLWDEANPWLAAWAAHVTKGGLVPFAVPFGDLTDIAAITAEEAVQGAQAKLDALAKRYNAADSLVVIATPSADGSSIDVAASRYGSGQLPRTDVMRVAGTPGEPPDALFVRAVAEIESQIEQNWKQENLLRFDREETLSVTVPFTDLGQWIAVRKRLGEIVFVRTAELDSLSKAEAVVGLHYLGDLGQLKTALAQKDLDLTQNGAAWTLRLTATLAAPPATGEATQAPGEPGLAPQGAGAITPQGAGVITPLAPQGAGAITPLAPPGPAGMAPEESASPALGGEVEPRN